jgi:bacterioferritin-associated ferredoxin/ribosome-associated toxin RatA of RatAB toxin-antitoxin module
MPDDPVVCVCAGVVESELTALIDGGCTTVDALRAACGANTGCGGCRTDLEELIEETHHPSVMDRPAPSPRSSRSVMPTVEVTHAVAAAPELAWSAVTDVESYADCMDNVRSVKITEHLGKDHRVSEWSTFLKGSILEWAEEEILDHEQMRISFHQVRGDLERFDGYWQVRPEADGASSLTLYVDFEIGIPLLADMLNPVAATALRENALQMLRAIEDRVLTAG